MTHPPPVSRPPGRMPDQISVSEFIAETTEDYNSPTTSSFTTRLHNCRNTVTLLEEVGRGRRPPHAPPGTPGCLRSQPLPSSWIALIPETGMFGAGEPHPLGDPRLLAGPGISDVQPPAPCAGGVETPEAGGGQRTEQAPDTPKKKREVFPLSFARPGC